jgi:hypothetical protein
MQEHGYVMLKRSKDGSDTIGALYCYSHIKACTLKLHYIFASYYILWAMEHAPFTEFCICIMMTEFSVRFIRATTKHNLLVGLGTAIFYVNRVCNRYKHFMTNGMDNEDLANGHQSHETEYPLPALQRPSKLSTLRELVEEPFKS